MEIGKIGGGMGNLPASTINNQVQDDSFAQKLEAAVQKQDDKELRKVCQDFEAIFMNMMYRQMKATIPKSDLMPADAGREMFESMLDEKLMEEASSERGMGLADALYKQLSKKNV